MTETYDECLREAPETSPEAPETPPPCLSDEPEAKECPPRPEAKTEPPPEEQKEATKKITVVHIPGEVALLTFARFKKY